MQIGVDLRVELISVLFHLAGNPEYQAFDTPYRRAVDQWFEAFRGHPAVMMVRDLRRDHSISYNAPIGLAVLLDPHTLVPLVDPETAPELDERWHGVDIALFLDRVRDFVGASNIAKFFLGQTGYMREVKLRLEHAILEHEIEEWYAQTFAAKQEVALVVVPGLLTGGWNYEASAHDTSGQKSAYQVVELEGVDPKGLPTPGPNTVELVAHEVGHAFVNPMVERLRGELAAAAQPLFDREHDMMKRNHYATPVQFVQEMVVRAIAALFTRDRFGREVASQLVRADLALGFEWNVQLAIMIDKLPRPIDLEDLGAKLVAWLRDEAPTISAMPPQGQQLHQPQQPRT